MAAAKFGEAGAFNINDQWATAIKYDAKLNGDQLATVDLSFLNGRKQLVEAVNLSRDKAIELIGESNVVAIEKGLGRDKAAADNVREQSGAGEKALSGKLQGELLTYREASTADYEPNVVQMGIAAEKTLDDEVLDATRSMVARRRQELMQQRQINLATDRSEAMTVQTSANAHLVDRNAENDEDRSKAVPASVTKRFVRVDEKFYFPDETLAFLDKGEALNARAEHKEVVSAIVAIAEARGWDKITVKGSEVFRRAVFMEAAQRGIEVKGYKPSEVERAKLEKSLGNGASRPAAETRVPENEVIKGIDRNAEKALDNTSHRVEGAEKIDGAPLRLHTGLLVAHGKAHYKHDPEESMNYWVTIRQEDGKEETIWGKDLERNFSENDFKAGEKINVAYMGNIPVKVNAPVRDGNNQVIDHQIIETNRNTWNVSKAEAFRNQSRNEAVAKHPDLAPAYGTMAAAKAFAKEKLPSKDSQERFVKAAKEAVAQAIEEGKPVPSAKIVKKNVRNVEADRPEKAKTKSPQEIER